MQYMGSKARLSKELAPIIQSYIQDDTKGYIEPFVGGANMIDKIIHNNKIGVDINEYLIELLKYAQNKELPESISEDEYNKVRNNKESYPKWYVGLVGFCGSFGAKWFGGFVKGNDNRDRQKEAIDNLRKQAKLEQFKNIKFVSKSFLNLPKNKIKGYVIYCDPPYKDTTKYKDNIFPYEQFYKWCTEISKDNIILISEYSMPCEFDVIWEKPHYTSMGSGINSSMKKEKIEKLFKVKPI